MNYEALVYMAFVGVLGVLAFLAPWSDKVLRSQKIGAAVWATICMGPPLFVLWIVGVMGK